MDDHRDVSDDVSDDKRCDARPSKKHQASSAKSLIVALRPFSLIVALATCGLGIALAIVDQQVVEFPIALAVMIAGLLLQVGVNLINDLADMERGIYTDLERRTVRQHGRLGWAAIILACMIGLYLVFLRGWPLLALGVIGVLGLWGYAAEPLKLKSRGLGLIAVFFLAGVFLVSGAYYAVADVMATHVLLLSLPFSLFACLLLLANELRDINDDEVAGHQTFTVRFGDEAGAGLYRGLLGLLTLCTLLLSLWVPMQWVLLPLGSLLCFIPPLRRLPLAPALRGGLPAMTGRCYLVYAVLYIGVLVHVASPTAGS